MNGINISLRFLRSADALVALVGMGVALVAALILLKAFVRARRIGLSYSRKRVFRFFTVLGAVFLFLALALAQPVLVIKENTQARDDVEVLLCLDNSGSAAAQKSSKEPTRLDLEIEDAHAARDAIPGVPVGVCILAGPYILPVLAPVAERFPTHAALDESVRINSPRPIPGCKTQVTDSFQRSRQPQPSVTTNKRCTTFDIIYYPLLRNFFQYRAGEARRIIVLFTDGEGTLSDVGFLADRFKDSNAELVLVHYNAPEERIYRYDTEADTYFVDEFYVPDVVNGEVMRVLSAALDAPLIEGGDTETLTDTLQQLVGDANGDANGDVIEQRERSVYLSRASVTLAVILIAWLLRPIASIRRKKQ